MMNFYKSSSVTQGAETQRFLALDAGEKKTEPGQSGL